MGLNIRNEETHCLAVQLAALTGLWAYLGSSPDPANLVRGAMEVESLGRRTCRSTSSWGQTRTRSVAPRSLGRGTVFQWPFPTRRSMYAWTGG
jgi:hypothetical protein